MKKQPTQSSSLRYYLCIILLTSLPILGGKKDKKRTRAAFEAEQSTEIQKATLDKPTKKRQIETQKEKGQSSIEATRDAAQKKLKAFESNLQTLKTRLIADHNLTYQGKLNILDQSEQHLSLFHIPIIKRIIPNNTIFLVKGDLHGDAVAIERFQEGLIKANKMNTDGKIIDPRIRVVFLGDYIDRGYDSIKTLNLLIELKDKNPQQVYLLRGNHETPEFIEDFDTPGTFGAQLEQLVKESGETEEYLENLILKFQQICSYMPQIFFAGYKHNGITSFITFLHGGIPTKTCPLFEPKSPLQEKQQEGYSQFNEEIKTLLKDETYINDSEILLLQLPCQRQAKSKNETFRIEAINPFLWNDFLKDPQEETRRARERSANTNILAISCRDTQQWLSDISTENIRVEKIVRGHQQGNRLLFMHPKYLGVWPACNQTVFTIDFSPRVPHFFEGHYKIAKAIQEQGDPGQLINLAFPDTWLAVIPIPEKNSFRADPINTIVPSKELPTAYQNLSSQELYAASLFIEKQKNAQRTKQRSEEIINQKKP